MIKVARAWLGTPYIHQASLKGVGCDCLGLIRGVWREVEGTEPEKTPAYSSSWAETGKQELLLNVANSHFKPVITSMRMPGDLIVFRIRPNAVAKHCGIMSGPGSFIHAYDGNIVVECRLTKFWVDRIAGVFRFPSATEDQN